MVKEYLSAELGDGEGEAAGIVLRCFGMVNNA